MDIIDIVGESLAERYIGSDQDRRRVRIVGLQRHDSSVRLQPERRRRGQGRSFVIDRIGRRRRARKAKPAGRWRRQDVGRRTGQRRHCYSATADTSRASLGTRARRAWRSTLARLRCRGDRCCDAGEQQEQQSKVPLPKCACRETPTRFRPSAAHRSRYRRSDNCTRRSQNARWPGYRSCSAKG
jgi:hypothetical protein